LVNKMKILKKKKGNYNNSKLFIVIKLLVIVLNDKFLSLSHTVLQNCCIKFVYLFSGALYDNLEFKKFVTALKQFCDGDYVTRHILICF
jgi:hypothetical protein